MQKHCMTAIMQCNYNAHWSASSYIIIPEQVLLCVVEFFCPEHVFRFPSHVCRHALQSCITGAGRFLTKSALSTTHTQCLFHWKCLGGGRRGNGEIFNLRNNQTYFLVLCLHFAALIFYVHIHRLTFRFVIFSFYLILKL